MLKAIFVGKPEELVELNKAFDDGYKIQTQLGTQSGIIFILSKEEKVNG